MTLVQAIQEIYQVAAYLALCMGFSVGILFWKSVLK